VSLQDNQALTTRGILDLHISNSIIMTRFFHSVFPAFGSAPVSAKEGTRGFSIRPATR
jgi:hypothetical protein